MLSSANYLNLNLPKIMNKRSNNNNKKGDVIPIENYWIE